VYNFAFGYYPATTVGEQACHPVYAPGRLLHNITTAHLELLRPGDLVFGRQSRRQANAHTAVRHVALWTGVTVDFDNATSPWYHEQLLRSVPTAHHRTHARCMEHQRALGRRVFVVADSNFAGPAYRPFCGPYLHNFSHARRVLFVAGSGEAVWPHANLDAVASWDTKTKSCVSRWALTEHDAAGVHPPLHRLRVAYQPQYQYQQQQHVRHHYQAD
jgi:hypothetical protein